MLDSIHVGVTGLLGYQRGLRVIANNTANLNTPGYKASSMQFADLFYANTPGTAGQDMQLGHGLDATGTRLDFRQGDLRQTGNAFDLALEGEGLFMLRDAQGAVRYARAGQFEFDASGTFVNRSDGSQVLAARADGTLEAISARGLQSTAGKATSEVRLAGNLSSTVPEQTVGAIKVFDARGAEHTLSLRFTSLGPERPDTWQVDLLDGAAVAGSSELAFVDGRPAAQGARLVFSYAPAQQAAQEITFDFGGDATSFASGSLSTLAMTTQDGYGPGNLAKLEFDANGTLQATYSNGQTRQGERLALARFASPEAVRDLGGNLYGSAEGAVAEQGTAGSAGFGKVRSGTLEMSNVDLSREFSELVIMQRGYQAASQVVSTANDMLQELFGMKRR